MLDLLLPHHDVDDGKGLDEVWFLGPDENTGTGGLLDWAAARARERGCPWWRAFTTGKMPGHGGIPHDRFGMTTSSVEAYVHGIYNKLGLKEEDITRIQTGGPDGDLGCNALLQTKSKTIAVIDGSGVLYDPEGQPTNAMLYNSSLLSPMGFKVDQEARDIT
ncbi:NAD-specific glutamate dehydrogenase, putative [Eimeria brunetti]|uniref:NAD-specific glutamate dehydrogenase, putative n=1 Tax=Eimeria brunetti TaxID=51314 RepID=U6LEC4_9EIME|nr:NAD-specific glutamate dehydrogenase, putative [Eimeria brunetti]